MRLGESSALSFCNTTLSLSLFPPLLSTCLPILLCLPLSLLSLFPLPSFPRVHSFPLFPLSSLSRHYPNIPPLLFAHPDVGVISLEEIISSRQSCLRRLASFRWLLLRIAGAITGQRGRRRRRRRRRRSGSRRRRNDSSIWGRWRSCNNGSIWGRRRRRSEKKQWE